ncbi:MAG: 3-oxoacyl-ACP reductase FabG [Peptostreptococcaceae bacterium]|nr:3-oxoacyl-ACP reductase FabG [Peptostreptococcaceae bacterium]
MIKNILITGGSRGIGAEAVRHFKSIGCNVVFLYKASEDLAKVISEETGAFAIKCDVSKHEEVEIAIKDAIVLLNNRVDVIICNAGISKSGLVTDISHEDWGKIIDTNLNGVYYCIKSVLPNMVNNRSGKIITISSMWGEVGASCEVAYSSAKAGIIGMTKALAKELAPSYINVNCIAPGVIDTDMNKIYNKEEMIEEIPMGRIGTVGDIVNTMEFLASDSSDYITGQIIGVNGGQVI